MENSRLGRVLSGSVHSGKLPVDACFCFHLFFLPVKYLVCSRARAYRPLSPHRLVQEHEGLNRLLVPTIHRWTSSQAGEPFNAGSRGGI